MMALAPLLAAAASGWTLVAGGDVMLNNVPVRPNPFAGALPLFRQADVAYANLEIPLTDVGVPTSRKLPRDVARKAQFILKASPLHVTNLADLGLDLASLANNHSMDFGYRAVMQMQRLLDRQRIGHAGAGANLAAAERPAVATTRGGTRVAMVSYLAFIGQGALDACSPATATSAGIATLPFGGTVGDAARERLRRIVSAAKRQGDVVLVALHWGIEKQTTPTPYQVALGRAFVDAGADIVIGTHPHVLQGAEVYRGKPILYSLGNLISSFPATTAVARLRYTGTRFAGLDWFPARIAGSKLTLLEGAAAGREFSRFEGLCRAIQTRYPHAESRVPSARRG